MFIDDLSEGMRRRSSSSLLGFGLGFGSIWGFVWALFFVVVEAAGELL